MQAVLRYSILWQASRLLVQIHIVPDTDIGESACANAGQRKKQFFSDERSASASQVSALKIAASVCGETTCSF